MEFIDTIQYSDILFKTHPSVVSEAVQNMGFNDTTMHCCDFRTDTGRQSAMMGVVNLIS